MRTDVPPPEDPRPSWYVAYQAGVLAVSAAVIVGLVLIVSSGFRALVGQPGGVALGLTALGQVVGATAPHGPAAENLPGIVGTPTATATPSPTATATPTASPSPTASPTPTQTPDTRFYDPKRASTLLAQAQTTFGDVSPDVLANVTLAAERLDQQRVGPGATISFNALAGPYDPTNGYRATGPTRPGGFGGSISTVDGGVTQVSTTLFQAGFWAGLKIVERHPHPTWLDRFSAGSTAQRGLDAEVSTTDDLRLQNTTNDWIRIEASVQPGAVTVAIYGADPGWSVAPNVSAPSKVVNPPATPQYQPDPSFPPGQQFTVSPPVAGFDVVVQRTVARGGQVVDRYGLAEHYAAMPAVIAVGPTPIPTIAIPTPAPLPTALLTPLPLPTLAPVPTPPSTPVPSDGRIKVPALVGLTESEAQQQITAAGLTTTYVNYQGPGDVPPADLNRVKVGQVLSQNPPAGTLVQKATVVYIAVRKA